MEFLNHETITKACGKPVSLNSTEFTGISTDSRNVKPGNFFVAIPGENFDPHQFLNQAVENGATGLLIQSDKITESELSKLSNRCSIWSVPNTLIAFRALAADYRNTFSIPVIAVIGSVGKTTTKEFIAALLAGKFKNIKKTEASQNGFLGIPLTLFQWSKSTEVAIVEIGIDEIGAMKQHMELVRPTLTILTQTGPEHLHQLKDEETAAREELIGLEMTLQNKGQIALNVEDPRIQKWLAAQFTGNFAFPYTRKTLQNSPWACPLPGEHQSLNLAGAMTVAKTLGLSDSEISAGLSTFKGATGRTEIIPLKNGAIILGDHYNSNPTSLKAALQMLKQYSADADKPNCLAVLGDMLELGENEELYHRNVIHDLSDRKINSVFLYGPRMQWLLDTVKTSLPAVSVQHFNSHTELANAVLGQLNSNSVVLIKGSRGMKLETVVRELQDKTSNAN